MAQEKYAEWFKERIQHFEKVSRFGAPIFGIEEIAKRSGHPDLKFECMEYFINEVIRAAGGDPTTLTTQVIDRACSEALMEWDL